MYEVLKFFNINFMEISPPLSPGSFGSFIVVPLIFHPES